MTKAIAFRVTYEDSARFWPKVDQSGECWIWTGAKVNGYGRFAINGKATAAHRYAYAYARGWISPDVVLDHLCRNRQCVRPEHLEPVSPQENVLRSPITIAAKNAAKTHCPHGHPYSPENTKTHPRGGRQCKTCNREQSRKSATLPA